VDFLSERPVTADVVFLTVAALAGIRAAVLERRVRALEEQAITDPLTGAFNRRQMHTTLAAAVERRRRSGEHAALLMFDIDRFKDINDALGHAEGDRVLKSLVALVGQRVRKVDALFRAGGEEFVLLLSGTRFADALSVAEDLRRLVQDARLVAGAHVSISIGVVELAHEQSASDWIEEADAALYRAKRAGRNRVAGRYGAAARFSSEPAAHNPLRFPVRSS
jgi:diguanylate cyclase (GGDEF)-like protein